VGEVEEEEEEEFVKNSQLKLQVYLSRQYQREKNHHYE
jgi:hypothetical protein